MAEFFERLLCDTTGLLGIRKVTKNKDPICVHLQWTFLTMGENVSAVGIPDVKIAFGIGWALNNGQLGQNQNVC